jgi:hypothetical protein
MDDAMHLEVGVGTNLPALFAAVAASVGVFAHGFVGHRWFMAQLRSVEMHPTRLSARLFGERDVSWRVFGVTWHREAAGCADAADSPAVHSGYVRGGCVRLDRLELGVVG